MFCNQFCYLLTLLLGSLTSSQRRGGWVAGGRLVTEKGTRNAVHLFLSPWSNGCWSVFILILEHLWSCSSLV